MTMYVVLQFIFAARAAYGHSPLLRTCQNQSSSKVVCTVRNHAGTGCNDEQGEERRGEERSLDEATEA